MPAFERGEISRKARSGAALGHRAATATQGEPGTERIDGDLGQRAAIASARRSLADAIEPEDQPSADTAEARRRRAWRARWRLSCGR